MPDFYGKEPTVPDLTETLPEGSDLAGTELKTQELIGEKEIKEAAQTLTDYKAGKGALESRIVKDEQWWKLRHWDILRYQSSEKVPEPEPTSAWLFNAILNKHADAMDNYPLPVKKIILNKNKKRTTTKQKVKKNESKRTKET